MEKAFNIIIIKKFNTKEYGKKIKETEVENIIMKMEIILLDFGKIMKR